MHNYEQKSEQEMKQIIKSAPPQWVYILTDVQDFQINNGDKKFVLLINVMSLECY